MWFEELPTQCPPSDATPANGEYYRLITGDVLVCEDFHSHRMLNPLKPFRVSECVARSLSVFSDEAACQNLTKLAIHRGKKIARVNLSSSDGSIKKTGKDKDHYSWWRSQEFDFSKATVIAA